MHLRKGGAFTILWLAAGSHSHTIVFIFGMRWERSDSSQPSRYHIFLFCTTRGLLLFDLIHGPFYHSHNSPFGLFKVQFAMIGMYLHFHDDYTLYLQPMENYRSCDESVLSPGPTLTRSPLDALGLVIQIDPAHRSAAQCSARARRRSIFAVIVKGRHMS